MSIKKILILTSFLIAGLFILAACAGPAGPVGPAGPAGPVGPAGPAGPAGVSPKAADLACTQCHNDTTLIAGKQYAWQMSKHGTENEDWLAEGTTQACSACHSGAAYIARMTASQSFADWGAAKDITLPDTTPITCRACHTIHTAYTPDDFALRSTAAVPMVVSGQTFDKGMGNLCVTCHQARRYLANFAAKDASGNPIAGKVDVSARFNPHLSNQSDMMLGVGGGGTVQGSPAGHYKMTTDSCVTCHLGESANHTFVANVSACLACHDDAKADSNGFIDVKFDANGVGARAEIQAKYDALKKALTDAKQLDETGAAVAVKGVDEAAAFPLWVYGYITEDGSMGVHNPDYANALLDAALKALGK
jgi:hypothetical protein